MLGICLDPNFASNGFVYLYYTTKTPVNRISRFHLVGDALDPASETVILDNIYADTGHHNGGTILIGPDGKLWAAPGDSGTGANSQDLSTGNFNGKVLRMELDGSPAAGNPFLGSLTVEQRIYAYGFRNPFRFSFRPGSGALFVGDVGQDNYEEIDVATPGATTAGPPWKAYWAPAHMPRGASGRSTTTITAWASRSSAASSCPRRPIPPPSRASTCSRTNRPSGSGS
jgi:glucose/arabinose dehydrogenase